jgi:hypothetical protein
MRHGGFGTFGRRLGVDDLDDGRCLDGGHAAHSDQRERQQKDEEEPGEHVGEHSAEPVVG